jgi:plastocyanin
MVVMSLLCSAAAAVRPQESAAPAPAQPTPQAKSGATIRGKLPIIQRKRPQVKEYGAQPAIKVDAPDASSSVVWIGSGFAPIDGTATPVTLITQSGYQFRPEVTVVQAGTRIAFPNMDDNYHSVFSLSENQQFDVGRYVKGEEPAARAFMNPGVIDLFCDVHDHMRGHIIVTDTPWFARSDLSGQFEIVGIAPGKHAVRIWIGPRRKLIEREVEVHEGQVLEVDWSSTDGSPIK